ncbi:MAG: hypothetical protein QXN53_04040 [Thermoproteota archaeon]
MNSEEAVILTRPEIGGVEVAGVDADLNEAVMCERTMEPLPFLELGV